MRIDRTILLALLLPALAACATMAGSTGDPTVGLDNPDVTRRVAENGDVIEEYRVAGQLRVVKVTPSRGPTYYLMDEDGDGRPDEDEHISPVYWKLFDWN
ncbi:DUF2782 domain-containing protein [Novilysobacter spongiicola]|uniref:DUF2782 domain-containing protein n=2 Tax=Novilysobacter TaxID=3382699 RepID=A0A1T4S4X2_9GAMM|nr:DUF2782 domain-containing protein [Lysobacter spongiicola]SKA23273.1 Protein of unknown function [Lysobacter spongiicola DSM 21749]